MMYGLSDHFSLSRLVKTSIDLGLRHFSFMIQHFLLTKGGIILEKRSISWKIQGVLSWMKSYIAVSWYAKPMVIVNAGDIKFKRIVLIMNLKWTKKHTYYQFYHRIINLIAIRYMKYQKTAVTEIYRRRKCYIT